MKKYILLTLILLVSLPTWAVPSAKTVTPKEVLTYDVYFRMGFLWAKAGRGTLSLSDVMGVDNESRLHGRLAAQSLSIVEHIMKVRDTLDCWMTPEYVPIEYAKMTHEGSYSAVERNYYKTHYKKGSTSRTLLDIDSSEVDIRRWRNKKGSDSKRHTVKAPAYDMLSVFYAIRRIDFSKMKPNESRRYAIHSGIRQQWMKVQYLGTETCTLRNGKQYNAVKVNLVFSSKDSDNTPLNVWLANDGSLRPLKVIIKLKRIGSVQGEIVE